MDPNQTTTEELTTEELQQLADLVAALLEELDLDEWALEDDAPDEEENND